MKAVLAVQILVQGLVQVDVQDLVLAVLVVLVAQELVQDAQDVQVDVQDAEVLVVMIVGTLVHQHVVMVVVLAEAIVVQDVELNVQ